MHTWLGLLAGVFIIAAGILIVGASLGIALGIAFEVAVVLGIVLLVMAGITAWLFYAGIKAQYRRVKTGKEALIGAHGVTTTELSPKGEVRVLGEFWQAISKCTQIASGSEVVVVDMDGMFLVVEPTKEKLNSSECK
jgi:membrane-bound serine protease (ClpP class)